MFLRRCLPLLALTLAADAGAITLAVGQGPDCSASSLSQALAIAAANGPGPHLIIASAEISYTNQRLFTGSIDVTIQGAHGCDGADDDQIVLNGDGANSVLTVSGTTNRTVTLRNLVVRNGRGSNGRGGGITMNGQVNVTLDNTQVRENHADSGGGGVYIENATGQSSGILALLPGSRIEFNTAGTVGGSSGQGGGVFAAGGRVRMHVSDTHISDNRANGPGGGIALVGGELLTGKLVEQADGTANGARVERNQSTTAGGGIYVFGTTGRIEANELIVHMNTAADAGAGIYATNSGYVRMQRDYPNAFSTLNCAWSPGCSRLSDNIVASGAQGGRGGALALFSGARADIAQTIIRANVAAEAPGAYVRGATLNMEGVVFHLNQSHDSATQGTAIIRTAYVLPEAVPQLRIAYATFARNSTTASNNQLRASQDILAQQNTLLELNSIAFYDSPYSPGTYGAYTDDCIVRTGGAGLDPHGTHTRYLVEGTPGFNNLGFGDYRLRSSSVLTDYCDTSVYQPQYRDPNLVPRCTDTPGKADRHGRCDVGAYESDHLFGTSFQP